MVSHQCSRQSLWPKKRRDSLGEANAVTKKNPTKANSKVKGERILSLKVEPALGLRIVPKPARKREPKASVTGFKVSF